MILEIDALAISFGAKRVLSGVSFSVNPGETVALMGPNGTGKTTVLKCVLGLLQHSGRIRVAGFDSVRQGVEARRRIGYVPQVPAFYAMTAREALRFLARLRGAPPAQAEEALRRVGLEADADRRIQVFSGGMQQRLSLAGALLGDPPLILLDEPTANLDPAARADLLGLLAGFRKAGKTLVLSSHRPRELRGLVDRVILLGDGSIRAQGPPEAVLPPDRIALHVEAAPGPERDRIAGLLAGDGTETLPSWNGSCKFSLPAERILPALELLRRDGIGDARIEVRPVDDGGAA